MKIYFTIHNVEEETHLKQELRNGGFSYTTFETLSNGTLEMNTPRIDGDDIEYLSQCYCIDKITD